jgi:exodeoxyribonuclease V alpha subunit
MRCKPLQKNEQDSSASPLNPHLAPGFTLSTEQANAAYAALSHGVTFITGGPGTGKTSIVTAIIKHYLENNGNARDIALCAPTGKAAKRLDETVRKNFSRMNLEHLISSMESASTIHRLLGISESRPEPVHHALFPLAHTLVVADEASMIDVALFDKFVNAVPTHANLVFLGDPNQLPSIEAGAILRALTQSSLFQKHTRNLTQSYRMNPESRGAGRNILLVAGEVNKGNVFFACEPAETASATSMPAPNIDSDSVVGIPQNSNTLRGKGVEFLCSQKHGTEILKLLGEFLPKHASNFAPNEPIDTSNTQVINSLCENVERQKVLCVTNTGRFGATSLNATMHNLYARSLNKNPNAHQFLPGEPVMVVGNDYSRNIFNGDVGVVVRTAGAASPTLLQTHVAFRRANELPILIPLEAIAQNIKHAFAITVHKSQGSEYEKVLLCLPETDGPLCSREIVYTALTRASKHCLIWGNKGLFRQAVTRSLARASLIDENDSEHFLKKEALS